MRLTEILKNPQSLIRRTILVLHAIESDTNNHLSDRNMIDQTADLFDHALTIAAAHKCDVVKHADRSVFVVCEATAAIEAVLAAVEIIKAAEADGLHVGAAIVTGELAWFKRATRGTDYMGAALERAYSIAKLTNAKAVCIDQATAVLTSETLQASLKLNTGHAALSKHADIQLPGFSEKLEYFEVLWNEKAYGVRSSIKDVLPNNDAKVDPRQWIRGTVSRIGPKFGFISDAEGVLYYFQSRNLVLDTPLNRGSRVMFHPLPPSKGAVELRAEDIFVLNAEVEGVVERINAKGWGFIKLNSQNGLEHSLFVLGLGGKGWSVGQRAKCFVGANDQGPMGYRVEANATAVKRTRKTTNAKVIDATDFTTEENTLPVPTRVRVTDNVLQASAAD